MGNGTSSKQPKASPKGITFKGLDFATAVKAALATGKAPPTPKRPKRKGKK